MSRFLVSLLILLSSQTVSAGTILVYGDSISAAYGIEYQRGWVSLLSDRVAPQYDVVNASVSGETTGGGLTRLPKTLEVHQPDIVILELGGNDGLRGYPIDKIRSNLSSMIEKARATSAQVLLVGMVLPPNYGRRYTSAFENTFSTLAHEYKLPFVPVLLEGVTTDRSLIQRDGIHPTLEAQPKVLEDIWQVLSPLLSTTVPQSYSAP
jgi:acyl-CoA thioesterase-1